MCCQVTSVLGHASRIDRGLCARVPRVVDQVRSLLLLRLMAFGRSEPVCAVQSYVMHMLLHGRHGVYVHNRGPPSLGREVGRSVSPHPKNAHLLVFPESPYNYGL